MTPKHYTPEDLKPTGKRFATFEDMERDMYLSMAGEIMRETEHYRVTFKPDKAGRARYVIRAKASNVRPRQKVVNEATWLELCAYSDRRFDMAVVLELGVGAFQA